MINFVFTLTVSLNQCDIFEVPLYETFTSAAQKSTSSWSNNTSRAVFKNYFTGRSSYASAVVLGIVILSVCPSVCLSVRLTVRLSVTRVLCDEAKEHTADF